MSAPALREFMKEQEWGAKRLLLEAELIAREDKLADPGLELAEALRQFIVKTVTKNIMLNGEIRSTLQIYMPHERPRP